MTLEDVETLTRLCSDPSKWIAGVLKEKGSLVLTMGLYAPGAKRDRDAISRQRLQGYLV
jgi:hypothetical protein